MKKPIIVLLMGLIVVFAGVEAFSQHEHEGHQHGILEEEQVEVAGEQEGMREEEGPIEVGNKICPVSGEEIGEGEEYKFEYEGKIYNFCCKMCVKDFKKDPQKYIEKLKEIEEKETHDHEGHQDHGEHDG